MHSSHPASGLRYQTLSRTPEETRELGRAIGKWIEPGTVLTLIGDLGSGKTVFVQGLGKGLEVPKEVYITSPTYTLIHTYPGRCPLHHVDLYRISGEPETEDIGLSEVVSDNAVVAVEWADRLREGSIPDRLEIAFEILDDTSRKIRFCAYGQLAENLLERLGQQQTPGDPQGES